MYRWYTTYTWTTQTWMLVSYYLVITNQHPHPIYALLLPTSLVILATQEEELALVDII